jgi:hypothetical protein
VNDETQGYHETITQCFIRAVRLYLSTADRSLPLASKVNGLLLSPAGGARLAAALLQPRTAVLTARKARLGGAGSGASPVMKTIPKRLDSWYESSREGCDSRFLSSCRRDASEKSPGRFVYLEPRGRFDVLDLPPAVISSPPPPADHPQAPVGNGRGFFFVLGLGLRRDVLCGRAGKLCIQPPAKRS